MSKGLIGPQQFRVQQSLSGRVAIEEMLIKMAKLFDLCNLVKQLKVSNTYKTIDLENIKVYKQEWPIDLDLGG